MSRVLNLIAALTGNRATGEATGLFTPPQFDDDLSIPTTAFVQRALGNSAGYLGVTVDTVLSAIHFGREIYASATVAPITLTLPAVVTFKAGAKLRIYNTGVQDVTVQRAGGDTIVVNNTSNTVTSIKLKPGDSIVLTSLGTGTLWYHGGGSAQLHQSGQFQSSKAAAGYTRLPGGIMVQWGNFTTSAAGDVTAGFPTPFATACWAITANQNNSTTGGVYVTTNTKTTAGFNASAWSAASTRVAANCDYMAFGDWAHT